MTSTISNTSHATSNKEVTVKTKANLKKEKKIFAINQAVKLFSITTVILSIFALIFINSICNNVQELAEISQKQTKELEEIVKSYQAFRANLHTSLTPSLSPCLADDKEDVEKPASKTKNSINNKTTSISPLSVEKRNIFSVPTEEVRKLEVSAVTDANAVTVNESRDW